LQTKILLVDDEENVRLSLGFWLRRNDCHVTLCSAADEARAALETETFDCVISDLRLTPRGLEGVSVLQQARSLQPTARRILVTASPSEVIPPALQDASAWTLSHKPVDVLELLRLIGGGTPDPAT
jgi:DNA-binding NtrC family response regulator